MVTQSIGFSSTIWIYSCIFSWCLEEKILEEFQEFIEPYKRKVSSILCTHYSSFTWTLHFLELINNSMDLNEVGKKNKLPWIWVLGHSGIEGNEEGNRLSRERVHEQHSLTQNHSLVQENAPRRKNFWRRRVLKKKLWQNLSGINHFKTFLWNFEISTTKRYLDLRRNQLLIITGFVTQHCRLK